MFRALRFYFFFPNPPSSIPGHFRVLSITSGKFTTRRKRPKREEKSVAAKSKLCNWLFFFASVSSNFNHKSSVTTTRWSAKVLKVASSNRKVVQSFFSSPVKGLEKISGLLISPLANWICLRSARTVWVFIARVFIADYVKNPPTQLQSRRLIASRESRIAFCMERVL